MSLEIHNNSYDRDQWLRALEAIATALGSDGDAVEVCLIGSSACIFGGMGGRTSIDLDVWLPNSDFDELELKRAVTEAGLLFDPKSELEPNTAYVQIVEPGLVQVGQFDGVLLKRMGRLRITRPPYENLVASKLVRADAKDIQDIQFLIQTYRVTSEAVAQVVESLPARSRDIARENMVYLEILK